jgi:hypothetical protein
VGTRFSALVQTDPGAHPASCTVGTGSFLGAKSGRGVTLTPHPLLVPWSRKIRAILLLPLWAVRPVQSLSACTRVRFTFLQCILPFYIFFKQYESYKKVQAAVHARKMKRLLSSYRKNKALSTTGLRSDGAANLLLTRVDMNKKV